MNWIRENVQSIDRASDLARRVLPTPGTSSMRTWPPDDETVGDLLGNVPLALDDPFDVGDDGVEALPEPVERVGADRHGRPSLTVRQRAQVINGGPVGVRCVRHRDGSTPTLSTLQRIAMSTARSWLGRRGTTITYGANAHSGGAAAAPDRLRGGPSPGCVAGSSSADGGGVPGGLVAASAVRARAGPGVPPLACPHRLRRRRRASRGRRGRGRLPPLAPSPASLTRRRAGLFVSLDGLRRDSAASRRRRIALRSPVSSSPAMAARSPGSARRRCRPSGGPPRAPVPGRPGHRAQRSRRPPRYRRRRRPAARSGHASRPRDRRCGERRRPGRRRRGARPGRRPNAGSVPTGRTPAPHRCRRRGADGRTRRGA